MTKITEVNLETGLTTERDMTAEEVAKMQTDKTDYLIKKEAVEAKIAEDITLKETAHAKLIALGITQEEIAVLLK